MHFGRRGARSANPQGEKSNPRRQWRPLIAPAQICVSLGCRRANVSLLRSRAFLDGVQGRSSPLSSQAVYTREASRYGESTPTSSQHPSSADVAGRRGGVGLITSTVAGKTDTVSKTLPRAQQWRSSGLMESSLNTIYDGDGN